MSETRFPFSLEHRLALAGRVSIVSLSTQVRHFHVVARLILREQDRLAREKVREAEDAEAAGCAGSARAVQTAREQMERLRSEYPNVLQHIEAVSRAIAGERQEEK